MPLNCSGGTDRAKASTNKAANRLPTGNIFPDHFSGVVRLNGICVYALSRVALKDARPVCSGFGHYFRESGHHFGRPLPGGNLRLCVAIADLDDEEVRTRCDDAAFRGGITSIRYGFDTGFAWHVSCFRTPLYRLPISSFETPATRFVRKNLRFVERKGSVGLLRMRNSGPSAFTAVVPAPAAEDFEIACKVAWRGARRSRILQVRPEGRTRSRSSAVPATESLPGIVAVLRRSPGILHGLRSNGPQAQQAARRVPLKLRDPNAILAKKIFDHLKREVTSLYMDYFRRRPDLSGHVNKIRISCDEGVIVIPGPLPNFPIMSLFESNVANVNASGEQR